MSPGGSVNGTFNTSGSCPPATWAWKVVASQVVSTGDSLMSGFPCWNAATCLSKKARLLASEVLGRSPTVMVTVPAALESDGLLEQAARPAATSRDVPSAAATRSVDFVMATP
jgi:hypothetical protein